MSLVKSLHNHEEMVEVVENSEVPENNWKHRSHIPTHNGRHIARALPERELDVIVAVDVMPWPRIEFLYKVVRAHALQKIVSDWELEWKMKQVGSCARKRNLRMDYSCI